MIAETEDGQIEAATDLLYRFFREEVFAGDRELIPTNLNAPPNDPHHSVAGCDVNGQIVGIVMVTTMLYTE